jgi:hypothetical protein
MDEKKRALRQQRWANIRKIYWPDLSDAKTLKSASTYSWGVALFIAFSYAVVAGIGYFYGWTPGGEELASAAMTATLVIEGCAVVTALVLAWFSWRRNSRIAAIIILAWIVVEGALKVAYFGAGGVVMSLVLILLAIGGLRAAFYQRRLADTASSIQTFS